MAQDEMMKSPKRIELVDDIVEKNWQSAEAEMLRQHNKGKRETADIKKMPQWMQDIFEERRWDKPFPEEICEGNLRRRPKITLHSTIHYPFWNIGLGIHFEKLSTCKRLHITFLIWAVELWIY